jgi:hypothetical protein
MGVATAWYGAQAVPVTRPARPAIYGRVSFSWTSTVGQGVAPVDALAKATGAAVYAADVYLPRTLVGRVVQSPYAHARIVSIDEGGAAAPRGTCRAQ